jgi:putative nucleotidyltransferase with HDIG domain
VANAAVAMARALDLSEADVRTIWRAALLHDIGKLSVSNTILDKPDKLTPEEWAVVRKHPYYTYEILRRVPAFSGIGEIAASHHEKLDGSGYFRNLNAQQLSLPARILVVADIYDALAAQRPYRDALPPETVLGMIAKDVPRALDASCFEALKTSCDPASGVATSLVNLSSQVSRNTAAQPRETSGPASPVQDASSVDAEPRRPA